MKKMVFLALAACLALVLFTFSSCSSPDPTFDEIRSNYADLAAKAKVRETENGAVIDFGRVVTLNRLVLRENFPSVTSFTLSVDGSSSPFYGNDFIGGYRYCAFPSVTTDKVLISADCELPLSITSVEAYYIPFSRAPFSVTSYITAKTAFSLKSAELPSDTFDIIYAAYLDKDGNTVLPDYYIDGERIEGETVLGACVANLRAVNPSARVLVTVLGDRDFDGDGLTTSQRCSSAFSQKEKTASSLLSLLSEYGADGISFDYEYPATQDDYAIFCDFCACLGERMPAGKLLSTAVSAWSVDEKRFSARSLSPFDRIVLMAYDEKNDSGCHSTFYTAYSQLRRLKEKGVPLNKILLGIPLYSKPVDGTSFVSPYSDYADSLPFFSNTAFADCDGQTKACYFNGRQLVSDKTSFAKDIGLCGVAAWHYSLDSTDPALSLLATAMRAANSFREP